MSKIEKRHATENDILVINDRHGFDENPNLDGPPILHDVLVDGHPARCWFNFQQSNGVFEHDGMYEGQEHLKEWFIPKPSSLKLSN